MIVDTSALVAVLKGEPDADALMVALAAADDVRISAATLVETSVVVDSVRDPVLSGRLDDLLRVLDVVVEPVDGVQASLARRAYRDFGGGSGHPAGLNLGDVFAYALARARDEPLLFTGDDFAATDVAVVSWGSPRG